MVLEDKEKTHSIKTRKERKTKREKTKREKEEEEEKKRGRSLSTFSARDCSSLKFYRVGSIIILYLYAIITYDLSESKYYHCFMYIV